MHPSLIQLEVPVTENERGIKSSDKSIERGNCRTRIALEGTRNISHGKIISDISVYCMSQNAYLMKKHKEMVDWKEKVGLTDYCLMFFWNYHVCVMLILSVKVEVAPWKVLIGIDPCCLKLWLLRLQGV